MSQKQKSPESRRALGVKHKRKTKPNIKAFKRLVTGLKRTNERIEKTKKKLYRN